MRVPWYCYGSEMAFESFCPGPWSAEPPIDVDGFDHSLCGPSIIVPESQLHDLYEIIDKTVPDIRIEVIDKLLDMLFKEEE